MIDANKNIYLSFNICSKSLTWDLIGTTNMPWRSDFNFIVTNYVIANIINTINQRILSTPVDSP